MVPCPWFEDFATHYKNRPELDVGIHVTLTAEWDNYKWGGVMPSSEIKSLLDENGHLYPSVELLKKHALAQEVEKEIRAQIDRAISFGIDPTHIDTHMGSVAATPEILQIYLNVGREYGIPVFVPRMMLLLVPEEVREIVQENFVLVDRIFMLNARPEGSNWLKAYGDMVEKMVPGLNQLIVHVAYDNAEMQAVCVNHPDFGSEWRQKDLELVTSKSFQDKLTEQKIQLISWKEIKAVM
jgi:predicted glycoside hydrolase/deacetylase ChbG (UPF0249 family)